MNRREDKKAARAGRSVRKNAVGEMISPSVEENYAKQAVETDVSDKSVEAAAGIKAYSGSFEVVRGDAQAVKQSTDKKQKKVSKAAKDGRSEKENDGGAYNESEANGPRRSRRQAAGFTESVNKAAAKFGRTQFEVDTREAGRLLGALGRECRLTKIKYGDGALTFFAPSKHCGKIIAILDGLCYNYKILKVTGAIPFAAGVCTRIGALAGIAAFVCALIVYPMFITDIDYNGTLNGETMGILSSYGIKKGAFLPSLDCNKVSEELRAADGVAFASVTKRGAHLYVTVKSELSGDGFVDVSGGAVKATKRAVVTRIIVHGGTAVKKYGDVVNIGDVIIEDYVLSGEEKIPAEARGEAYGKIYYEHTSFFSDTRVEKVYGAEKSFSELALFGVIPPVPDSPFEFYELKTEVRDYGFLIPFKVFEYTFREIKFVERTEPIPENEMKLKAYSALMTQISADARILDRYYTVSRSENGTYIKVIIEAEERIA